MRHSWRPVRGALDVQASLSRIASRNSTGALQAMVRDRVVAEDWLVAIDGNRYPVPFTLIGRTVQVTREGGSWVIRHRGAALPAGAVWQSTAHPCIAQHRRSARAG
jgi:hypothetical protein